MKYEIVEFSKESYLRVGEIDDIVDQFSEEIKDLTETASDILNQLKLLGQFILQLRK